MGSAVSLSFELNNNTSLGKGYYEKEQYKTKSILKKETKNPQSYNIPMSSTHYSSVLYRVNVCFGMGYGANSKEA